MPFLDLAKYTTVLSMYNKLHIDNMTYATLWSCYRTIEEQAEIWTLLMR